MIDYFLCTKARNKFFLHKWSAILLYCFELIKGHANGNK